MLFAFPSSTSWLPAGTQASAGLEPGLQRGRSGLLLRSNRGRGNSSACILGVSPGLLLLGTVNWSFVPFQKWKVKVIFCFWILRHSLWVFSKTAESDPPPFSFSRFAIALLGFCHLILSYGFSLFFVFLLSGHGIKLHTHAYAEAVVHEMLSSANNPCYLLTLSVSLFLLLFLLVLLHTQISIQVSFIPIFIPLLQSSVTWLSQTSRMPPLASAQASWGTKRAMPLFYPSEAHLGSSHHPENKPLLRWMENGSPCSLYSTPPLQAQSRTSFITQQLTRRCRLTACVATRCKLVTSPCRSRGCDSNRQNL